MSSRETLDASHDLDWGRFFARYRPVALRMVRGWLASNDTAEDVFQDAARSVYERVRSGALRLESESHARNYLFRALRNLATSQLRARPAPDELIEDPAANEPQPWRASAAAEEAEQARTRRDRVETALRSLGSREREALHLRYGEGLTFRQMSDRTGAAISTLQGRVEAALEKLRGRIGKRGGRS